MTAGKRGRPAGSGSKFDPVPLPGLKAARLAAGESLLAAGQRIGVNAAHMRKLEAGTVRLDVARAATLASAYKLPVESFLSDKAGPPVADAREREAESLALVLEREAAAAFAAQREPGRGGYATAAGRIEARLIRDAQTQTLRVVWRTLSGRELCRAEAVALIRERMESRLS